MRDFPFVQSYQKHSTMADSVSPESHAATAEVAQNGTSLQWLRAIQDATKCLRGRSLIRGEGKDDCIVEIEHALQYLCGLERLLVRSDWDHVPEMAPPKFKAKTPVQPSNKKGTRKGQAKNCPTKQPSQKAILSPVPTNHAWSINEHTGDISTNRFAMFLDEEENDCREKKLSTLFMATPNKAGIALATSESCKAPAAENMVMRRIMIRLVTAQSELYAYQASIYRSRQFWSVGAQRCHCSLLKTHEALLLADSEISRSFYLPNGHLLREKLVEDASIVEVAVRSLTQERDDFVHKALKKKMQLIRKLELQYISRQAARLALGEKKWTNNPKPKNRGVTERAIQEEQLQEVRDALEFLSHMDTLLLKETTEQMKEHLSQESKQVGDRGPKSPRHNQIRPDLISERVDQGLYPDPVMFGWKFTGSQWNSELSGPIEYFEKKGILLDFHLHTGAIELSWQHLSRQGNTTFYKSQVPVGPTLYRKIIASSKPWEIVLRKINHRCNSDVCLRRSYYS